MEGGLPHGGSGLGLWGEVGSSCWFHSESLGLMAGILVLVAAVAGSAEAFYGRLDSSSIAKAFIALHSGSR